MRKKVVSDVFVDVCLQRDYLHPDGARPSANLNGLRKHIKQVLALVRYTKAPLLSLVEAQREYDHERDSRACVLGTYGQRKVPFSVLPNHLVVDCDNSLSIALDITTRCQQTILYKPNRDPFSNPKLDRLLTEMPARRFVLFGVALDDSIRHLALGLVMRQRPVAVIYDACGYWDREKAEMNLRQLTAKDIELISTQNFIRTQASQRGVAVRTRRVVA